MFNNKLRTITMDKEKFYFEKMKIIKTLRNEDNEISLIEANKLAAKILLVEYYLNQEVRK